MNLRISLLFLSLCSPAYAEWKNNFSLVTTYGPEYREPNNPKNQLKLGTSVAAIRVNFNYENTYDYGTNFLSVGYAKYNSHDAERLTNNGATQLSTVYRGLISGNSVIGSDYFTTSILKDLRFEFGVDYNTKNNNLSSRKKQILVGGNISFNVPGFLNIGILYSKEYNHNGVIGKNFEYDSNVKIELSGMQPLSFTGYPLRLDGFINIATPKGKDGFGRNTKTELLAVTRLILDVGDLLLKKPKIFDVFIGYQYWYNKYGSDNRIKTGAIENTWIFGSALRF